MSSFYEDITQLYLSRLIDPEKMGQGTKDDN